MPKTRSTVPRFVFVAATTSSSSHRGCQQLVRFVSLSRALSQAAQAHRGLQLQGLRPLAASDVEDLMETSFRLRTMVCRTCQRFAAE
jgi:hypothetical protein